MGGQTLITGKCSCGEVNLHLDLPNKLNTYEPRACDCDFCIERNIVYLSDSKGKLTIHSKTKLQTNQHGSEQASFLSCNTCNNVVAVVCKIGDVLKGAVNATLFKDFQQMKKPHVVSPKLLSAQEKLDRWSKLWLTVKID